MEKSIDFDLVADLYDTYVDVDFDVGFYLDYCKQYKRVLELMCGTGRVSVPLIEAGVDLTCVDYSQEMLNVLSSKLSSSNDTTVLCQDVTELDLADQFDLIFVPFNSFSEITDASKREQAFQRASKHLVKGGTLFVTLYNPEYRKLSADGSTKTLGRFELDDGKHLVVSYFNSYSQPEQLVHGTQFYEIFDQSDQLVEKRQMEIRFSLIQKEEMLALAEDAGFKLQIIYGDYQGTPFAQNSMFMNFEFVKQETPRITPPMTIDELLFFDAKPGTLPLYEAVRDSIFAYSEDIIVKVSKTQIAFSNRYQFAFVSHQRVKGSRSPYILLTFGLGRREEHPRIAVATEPYPGRWTHHVVISTVADVDDQIMEWVTEAYDFASIKGMRNQG